MCWGCMHPNFPDPPTSGFFEALPHFPGINIPTLEVVAAGAAVVAGALAIGSIVRSKSAESGSEAQK